MQDTILIVGDSLGLPRENMPYEKTWPRLVSKFTRSHVVAKVQRALTTATLHSGMYQDWLEFYTPNMVILQVGIVDCAPRYIKNGGLAMKLLGVAPGPVKSAAWKIIKKAGRKAKYADVSSEKFKANLEKYIDRCVKAGVSNVLLISIARSGSAMVRSNPGVLGQLTCYNEIIRTVAEQFAICKVIDVLAYADDAYFLEDGYHLNEYGNQQLFNELSKHIKP